MTASESFRKIPRLEWLRRGSQAKFLLAEIGEVRAHAFYSGGFLKRVEQACFTDDRP